MKKKVSGFPSRLLTLLSSMGMAGQPLLLNRPLNLPVKRENFRKYFFSTLIILLVPASGLLAQDPQFTSIVSANRVVQHSIFEIQFELKNARGEDFTPPSFENFEVVAGPAIGSSTVIINGQISRGQSWTFSLLAKKPGTFTIGSAYIIAGRKKLATRPVAIEVMAANDPGIRSGTSDEESIILRAEVADQKYYPGQQIVMHYRLIYRENIQTVNTISEDDYADFFVQPFNPSGPQATLENIGGVSYTSRVIKSVALYAHQSGTYTIDPFVIEAGINVPYPGNQGFFTMRRLKNVPVASKPLTIEILPLPSPVPADFSGAVGQYEIKAVPGATALTTDDDFSMRIEILGTGDSRRWDPPEPMFTGEFEMYDPRIEDNLLNESEGQIIHSRIIEYRMIPKEAGNFEVYLPFSFFNPMKGEYDRISTDTFSLVVTQGSGVQRSAVMDTLQKPAPIRKVNAIYTDDRFWTSPLNLGLTGLILSGGLFAFFLQWKQKREEAIPHAEKIRSSAARHARQQLEILEKRSNQIPAKDFFEEATQVYYKFLTDKFTIPPADLDGEHLRQILAEKFHTQDEINSALQFFQQSLSVRYGGTMGGLTTEQMITALRDQIDQLDHNPEA